MLCQQTACWAHFPFVSLLWKNNNGLCKCRREYKQLEPELHTLTALEDDSASSVTLVDVTFLQMVLPYNAFTWCTVAAGASPRSCKFAVVLMMLAAPVCAPTLCRAIQVQDVMLAIHTLWGAPVLIAIILGLLYQQLGWATFVGLVVVAIYSPISSEWAVAGHITQGA